MLVLVVGWKWASTSNKLLHLCSSHFQIEIFRSFQWWEVPICGFWGHFFTCQNVSTHMFYRVIRYNCIQIHYLLNYSVFIRLNQRPRKTFDSGRGCSFFLYISPYFFMVSFFFWVKRRDGLLGRWQKGGGVYMLGY